MVTEEDAEAKLLPSPLLPLPLPLPLPSPLLPSEDSEASVVGVLGDDDDELAAVHKNPFSLLVITEFLSLLPLRPL